MKTFKKSFLPDSITYNGEIYHCNGAISGAMSANNTKPSIIYKSLKWQNRKCVLVLVLSNNLKGKEDLHGKPYQPTKWIFTTNTKP
ncbi:MAG: hypothetical protein ABI091_26950 [Ferruginibacter sp.]